MTARSENPMSHADGARKAATPWRGRSIPVKHGDGANAHKQRAALKKLDPFEAETGISLEAFQADQAAQRARVRARFGGGL